MKIDKPNVAFFDFASCEGCQVELTNLGDPIFLELLKHINLVEFREVMSEKTQDKIDIACIEGAFTREQDRERLLDIRERSDLVIAYGQCAVSGGITALKNRQSDYQQYVYLNNANKEHLASDMAKPISSVIKVDYQVLGCPINKMEFLDILSHLLHGKEPVIPNYPVCVECKRNETVCLHQMGEKCLGMVTRAGCGAPCPADGIVCDGCRGTFEDANLEMIDRDRLQLFNANSE